MKKSGSNIFSNLTLAIFFSRSFRARPWPNREIRKRFLGSVLRTALEANGTRVIALLMAGLSTFLLHADQFSLIAERHNVLDHTIKPALWATQELPVKIDISGYVKAEGIFDTRQNFTERDGHFLFFPLNRLPDVNGRDINGRGEFDEYAIQTRVRFEAFGADVGCFRSRSYIEADFFGTTDDTLDSFRMRHAYLCLESDDFDFWAGQTWHPMYFPVEAPDTISFNTGTPIDPYIRAPQFRLVYHNEHFDVVGTLIGILGDRPFGPLGPTDKYFRDSIMPDMNLQTRFKWDDGQQFIGLGVDFMRITPRLVSNTDYKDVNPFNAFSAIIYSRFAYDDHIILYNKFCYADDAAIWDMIGGYAVHTVDPITDSRTYVPLRTISWWSELIFQGPIEPALFIGWVENIGAKKTIIQNIGAEQTVYGLGTNIKSVLRASPRIRVYIKSFVLGAEVEYTRATYGTLDNFGNVTNTIPVGNTRFLFATYYIF